MKRFIEVGDLTGQIAQAMRNVSESLKVVDLADFQRRTSNIFQEIGRHFKNTERAQKILDAGWVPYAGMPIDDLPEQATADQVDIFMNSLIGDRWVEVRNCLANTVAMSKVDEEAVVTFDEALSAFENGHYRSVVRVLFPEIERVARDTVYGGSRKDWSIDERKETRRLNTGLGALRESLMQHLPAGLGVYADFGFALTQKMDSHLYRYVESTPEDLAALQADPVPNRHASQHGYVTYSTAQNAYNALSMTAFMFDTILRVDGYLRRKAQVET
ncbi:hypothetical protein [Novosphingobium sp.]|uniref:hypothetical protein n=1 Tax=Novosphingobium sp. TaxID=1874826 RepID=UPI002589DA1B|nr:hypothetical protein [Novosphingobium sp.]